MNVLYEHGAVPLDCIGKVASWRRPILKSSGQYPMVVVMQSSTCDEGIFVPAADVTVYGKVQLIALRLAIDEALKEGGEA